MLFLLPVAIHQDSGCFAWKMCRTSSEPTCRYQCKQVDVLGGCLCLGLNLSPSVKKLSDEKPWQLLGRYAIIGEVVMLSESSATAFVRGKPEASAHAQSSLKELLAEALIWGPKLLANPR